MTSFEAVLSGGHPNSLGRTLEVVEAVLADRLLAEQRSRAIEIMKNNLARHSDWIVLNNSMKVLSKWSQDDPELRAWLRPHARRLVHDDRKSVASNARNLVDQLGTGERP